jgi:hypothetical protein
MAFLTKGSLPTSKTAAASQRIPISRPSRRKSCSFGEQKIDSRIACICHFLVHFLSLIFCIVFQGRFLLAAASGRVLARSFHEAVVIGLEALAGATEMRGLPSAGGFPIITWRKRELSILLEHVQAHVAPTDVDLNAGIQWLPKVTTLRRRCTLCLSASSPVCSSLLIHRFFAFLRVRCFERSYRGA